MSNSKKIEVLTQPTESLIKTIHLLDEILNTVSQPGVVALNKKEAKAVADFILNELYGATFVLSEVVQNNMGPTEEEKENAN